MRTRAQIEQAARRAYGIIKQLETEGLTGPKFKDERDCVEFAMRLYDDMIAHQTDSLESGRIRVTRDDYDWIDLFVNVSGDEADEG